MIKKYVISFRDNLNVIRQLLYRKSILLLIGSVLFGLLGSWAEIGLAVALNGILVVIGLVDIDKLPEFLQSMDLSGKEIILITCLFLFFRAVTLFWKQMTSGVIYWDFKRLYEQKLVSAAIADESNAPMSGAYVSSMIANGIPRAGNVIRGISDLLLGIVVAIPLIGSLLVMNVKLAMLSFLGIVFVGICTAWISRYTRVEGTKISPIFNDFTERYLRSIRNRILLRIYGIVNDETHECLQGSQKFRERMTTVVKWSALGPIIINLILPIWLIVVVWVALTRLDVLPGILLPFFYLFLRLGTYLSGLSGGISAITADIPAARELASVPWISDQLSESMNIPADADNNNIHKQAATAQKDHSEQGDIHSKGVQIEANNVSAAYSNTDVFKNISFFLPSGDCLGVVGPSGSGKSTLIAVITGLMEPGTGEVLIDNVHTGHDHFLSLRKNIGYVGPEPLLKQGTIYDNLVYGLSGPVETKRIFKILEDVQLQEISQKGQKGLDSRIYEGGEGLSSGQKQRLCLARALLRNPRLLILDEATANIDEKTEKFIVEYLRQLKGKITIIVASHRKYPLTLADQTIDLENERKQNIASEKQNVR